MNLTDEQRRKLTIFIGELHECVWGELIPYHDAKSITRYSCSCGGDCVSFNHFLHGRPFTTPADLSAVYGKLVETGRWRDYWDYISQRCDCMMRPHEFTAWLFCLATPSEIPDRMAVVAEFLGEEG